MENATFTMALALSDCSEQALSSFLDSVKRWVYACMERYSDHPPIDNHDQLTYLTGWEPYVLATRDAEALRFMTDARDRVTTHFVETDAWRHGYWRMQEAHHGTEHFELFLGCMLRLNPDDDETRRQIIDAVEHVGNWNDTVEDWFDPATGLFRSLYFGTDGIRPDPHQLNMPDHLRCANVLMLAHDATADSKYIELAEAYARRWAVVMADDSNRIPIAIARDGVLYDLTQGDDDRYHAFAGQAGDLESDLDRAENVLASGGVQLFLRLWEARRDPIFLQAVQRLLHVLTTQLTDPDAGVVADAVRHYRNLTGGREFDPLITAVAEQVDPHAIREVTMELSPPMPKRPEGVGKRADQLRWLEDGKPRTCNPILLSVAAEINGDGSLATRAIDLARSYFDLAAGTLRSGRHHGCAARTVSAVARGHGRENHAGVTTAVLLPALRNAGRL